MKEYLALRVDRKDGKIKTAIQALKQADLPTGDVLIQGEYSSVNYKDALAASGRGKVIRRFPLTAGIDIAGRVAESDHPSFRTGDPVLVTGYDLGVSHDGGYAEYARVPARWVVPIPKGMDPYIGMALGTAGFTAALCIYRLQQMGQQPGHGPFVVTGATGGVGSIAVNLLSHLGYEVVALTGKLQETDWLKRLGASRVLDRQAVCLDNKPLQQGNWGGAIDNIGGDFLHWLLSSTKPWGNIAAVGLASASHLNTTLMPFILRGVSLLGITASACPAEWRQDIWQRLASSLMPPNLEEIVSKTVRLEQLPAIFEAMLAGQLKGRVVVKLT